MDNLKTIENIISKVDSSKTRGFYLSQNLIKDDCSCEDCKFYQDKFIKYSLDIFKTLDGCGVDLRKNINDEPTGVWVVCEEDKLVHCEPAYRLIGDFKDINEDVFKLINGNYNLTMQVFKNDNSFITIYLTFDKIE